MIKGAKNPQSSSTSFGLSNAMSMFIEIRGIGLGRESFARRAGSGFTVAKSMLHTCAGYQKEIQQIIRKANKETVNRIKDIQVTSTSPVSNYPVRFVDFFQMDIFSVDLTTVDNLITQPILTRERPVAYLLTDTCRRAIEILETVGLKVEKTDRPLTLQVERYEVTGYKKVRYYGKVSTL
ncbi:MAG: hypothetical protein LIP01_03950 [Tannerellaceae bacterium]|nr:hypothetical protein [Tannerellaceae bacterium]